MPVAIAKSRMWLCGAGSRCIQRLCGDSSTVRVDSCTCVARWGSNGKRGARGAAAARARQRDDCLLSGSAGGPAALTPRSGACPSRTLQHAFAHQTQRVRESGALLHSLPTQHFLKAALHCSSRAHPQVRAPGVLCTTPGGAQEFGRTLPQDLLAAPQRPAAAAPFLQHAKAKQTQAKAAGRTIHVRGVRRNFFSVLVQVRGRSGFLKAAVVSVHQRSHAVLGHERAEKRSNRESLPACKVREKRRDVRKTWGRGALAAERPRSVVQQQECIRSAGVRGMSVTGQSWCVRARLATTERATPAASSSSKAGLAGFRQQPGTEQFIRLGQAASGGQKQRQKQRRLKDRERAKEEERQ